MIHPPAPTPATLYTSPILGDEGSVNVTGAMLLVADITDVGLGLRIGSRNRHPEERARHIGQPVAGPGEVGGGNGAGKIQVGIALQRHVRGQPRVGNRAGEIGGRQLVRPEPLPVMMPIRLVPGTLDRP